MKRSKYRLLIWCLTALFVILFGKGSVRAQGVIVLSSQVRGFECCDVGSLSALKLQADTAKRLNLPMTFALRYDALKEPTIVSLLRQNPQLEAGGFLEITPALASESGVTYRGPVDRWYKAGNAYLIGYTPAQREKLLQRYMQKFHETFGYYPRSTVAWMIDSWSLQYLQKNFDVHAHEITRDQWGTDSYTLYGGPMNIPYFPSKNWALIPAKADVLPIVIVRQTVSDPRFTYGDAQSSFTSQPNDYEFGNKNFTYFQNLLDNAIKNTYPVGFAVLGLETSMEDRFQAEFVKQLEYVATMRDKGTVSVIKLSDVRDHFSSVKQSSISAYLSPDDTNRQAMWITTSSYRARVIRDRTEVKLTDLRIYSDDLHDPYEATASSTLNAYWTVPFLFDGSRFRVQKRNLFWSLFRPKQRDSSDFGLTQNDFDGTATGLIFPDVMAGQHLTFAYKQDQSSIQYPSSGGDIAITFLPDKFKVQLPLDLKAEGSLHNQALDDLRQRKDLYLETAIDDTTMTYIPRISPRLTMLSLKINYPELFNPEESQGKVDFGKSTYIVVNRHAVVSRNPIRIVIRLVNSKGLPTLSAQMPVVHTANWISTQIQVPESAHGEYYIDLSANQVGNSPVTITFGRTQIELWNVSFVPDCLRHLKTCATHPKQAIDYSESKVSEFVKKYHLPL